MQTRLLSCLLLLASCLPVGAQQSSFEFQKINRTYEAFIEELAPVVIGPATIALSSQDHSLTLASHKAVMTPLDARGEFRIDLSMKFSGRGVLDADVSMGAIKTQLSDNLAVPAQTLDLSGRVRITAGETGYTVTTLEMTPEVEVRIDSGLAKRLFRICHQMVLVLVNLDCVALEQSLTNVKAPLPPPGESYLLPYEELTEQERRDFDAFLLRN